MSKNQIVMLFQEFRSSGVQESGGRRQEAEVQEFRSFSSSVVQ
jgi:hypothetical protein